MYPKRPREFESQSEVEDDERASRRRCVTPNSNVRYACTLNIPFPTPPATQRDFPGNNRPIHTYEYYQSSQFTNIVGGSLLAHENYNNTGFAGYDYPIPNLVISGAVPQPSQCQDQYQQQYYSNHLLSPYTAYRDSEDVIASPRSTGEISGIGTPKTEFSTSPSPGPAFDAYLPPDDINFAILDTRFQNLLEPDTQTQMDELLADAKDEMKEASMDGEEESEMRNMPTAEENEMDEIPTNGEDEMDGTSMDAEEETDEMSTDGEDEMDEEICYGMIIAHAQLLPSKNSDNIAVDAPDFTKTNILQPHYKILEVSLKKSGFCFLLSSPDEPCAVLDCSTTAILESLKSCNFDSLRFQAVCTEYPPFSTNSIGMDEEEEEEEFSINLNIYGLRSYMDTVGTALRVLKSYLQQPFHIDDGVEYDNPHYFKPAGQKTPWVERTNKQGGGVRSGDEQSFGEVLTNVLECQLTHADGLKELETPSIIKTSLLRHQRQGLDFISRREAGITMNGYSLWRKLDGATVTPRFQNLLNGDQQSHPPNEPRGGIIADEMGLGKTLTMISAIAASLGEASEFATDSGATSSHPNTKSTLVIVPLILLSQWAEQIERHTVTNSMTYSKYHGDRKALSAVHAKSLDSDIILTTYSKVSSEFSKNRGSGLLYTRNWFRIVLDEAHEIRNSKSNQFRAICALSAQRRWCLTGTPIHNSLEDLAALFQWMNIPLVDTRALFKQHITNPIKTTISSDVGMSMANLRLLLTTYCLRRKKSIIPELQDQSTNEIIRRLNFVTDEHQDYETMKIECNRAVEKAIRSIGQQGFFSVFQAIMRLRLFCNHGKIPETSMDFNGVGDALCTKCCNSIDFLPESGMITKGYSLLCGHLVCTPCFSYSGYQNGMKRIEREGSPIIQCLVCRRHSNFEDIEEIGEVKLFKKWIENSRSGSLREVDDEICRQPIPTKIRALLEDIQNNPENEKSIIFSSWVRSLALTKRALEEAGISYVLIHGKLKLDDRKKCLKKFREDPHTLVLLMTTGTGAAGLNLTAASRVHLLEPQWNPMVEAQAIGRVARLGQTRPVTIYRYVMTATIEENIRTRQLKKQTLAEVTIDTSEATLTENHMYERLKEIRSLL